MKTAIFSSRLTAIALTAIMGVGSVLAQSYYDDDIYYDPAKAKKEQKKKVEKKPAQTYDAVSGQYYYDGAGYVPWNNVGDFQSADTYVPAGGSTRDVDEYNRHSTTTAQPDSISLEQYEAMAENMANTRNLARFHDSEVAKEAYNNDDYYADAYNAGYNEGYSNGISQPQTSLVVSVNSGWPYYNTWPYYSAWYNPYRYWGWNSWYDPYWSWNWGPSWSWGWGPSWSWGWGPAWGWTGPSWSWAPPRYYNNPPGATRPNRPSGNRYYGSNSSANRYGNGNHRGSVADSNGRRYGVATGTTGATSRPGYQSPVGRPTTAGSVGNNSYQRGRGGYNSSTSTPSRNSYNATPSNNRNNSSNSSQGSYNRGRSNSGFSSGSMGRSSGSSRSGGGFSGGGSRSGGGGGHRGR